MHSKRTFYVAEDIIAVHPNLSKGMALLHVLKIHLKGKTLDMPGIIYNRSENAQMLIHTYSTCGSIHM